MRTSHGIGALAETVTRDKLIEECDKELSFTGSRMIDQNRFNIWHLPAGAWHFMPITQRERDANTNF